MIIYNCFFLDVIKILLSSTAMDDLDHSVLIAEQDWDCFCTESEECSVQQARLAALDESGFSDTDDDKTFVHVSSFPTQTSPDQFCEEDRIKDKSSIK